MGIDSIRTNNKTIRLAIWVKKHDHSLREIGLIFFTLALFTGVIWISGKDVEPIAFVLGSISTLLFVSPSLARYVLPDRKPVRHMRYEEILDFLTSSNPKLDWKWIETSRAEEAFLKEDPRLRIRVRYDEDGILDKDSSESWATIFSSSTANGYWFDLAYEGALIERFILVSVDDGQAKLPPPDTTTLEVDPLAYKVAQIFDQHNTLEKYMGRAGLTVKNA